LWMRWDICYAILFVQYSGEGLHCLHYCLIVLLFMEIWVSNFNWIWRVYFYFSTQECTVPFSCWCRVTG
jgi:hypothetical protein